MYTASQVKESWSHDEGKAVKRESFLAQGLELWLTTERQLEGEEEEEGENLH